MPSGLGSRVAVSIAVFFGWLIFIVVWLVFYSHIFSLLENIGIVIVAFLIGVAVLAVMWASWGMRFKDMKSWEHASEKPARKRKR